MLSTVAPMADDHTFSSTTGKAYFNSTASSRANSAAESAAVSAGTPQVAMQAAAAAAALGGQRGGTQAEPSRLLNSKHPRLLLQLDRLQEEIEARGGHAVLELSPRSNSIVQQLELSPPLTAAVASASAATSGASSRTLPLKSPRLWKPNHWQSRPRQLVRPPSVPARLDSMMADYAVDGSDSRQYGEKMTPSTSTRVFSPIGGDSESGAASSLPPKSPRIWKADPWQWQSQSQPPRQLVRPPSVPARLDSMMTITLESCAHSSAAHCSAHSPRIRGIISPPSNPVAGRVVAPIGPFHLEPGMGSASANAAGKSAASAGAVSPRSLPSSMADRPHAMSARPRQNRLSARGFRSSSNIDLSGEDTLRSSEPCATCSTSSTITGATATVSSASSATTLASSPKAPLPKTVSRRYAQRVFARSQDFDESVRSSRTSHSPTGVTASPSSGHYYYPHDRTNADSTSNCTSPRIVFCNSNTTSPYPKNNRSQSKQHNLCPSGEAAGAAVRLGHRNAKSLSGDFIGCDLVTSPVGSTRSAEEMKLAGDEGWRSRISSSVEDGHVTDFREGFRSSGAPSPSSRRSSVGGHTHTTFCKKTYSGRTPTIEVTNDIPTVPAPSPRQPINHTISGSSFGQRFNTVPCAPRQMQLRERILGVRYSRMTDKFHISREKIGEGGSGEIRKCLEWTTGKVFACKTIHKSNIKRSKQVSDLRSEVLLLDLLKSHRGVVQLHEVFEDHKAVHVVMELCNGGDLFDFIQSAPKNRLTEPQAASVMRQLLGVLHHCHSLGVLHRDVKPENILLCDRVSSQSGNGDVKIKLSDFGVAGFLDEDGACRDQAGTSEYMAPEVARKAAYNAKADIWSAGVVLHAMLAGTLPSWAALPDAFNGQDQILDGDGSRGRGETMQEATAQYKLPLKGRVWADVSEEAKNLLRGMLEKDPKKRLSASEALGHGWLNDASMR
ncbi:hypothetical protein CLOM_g10138 [Closterium sp. NIES-68]|nr:hypothetical protein CLOM_g10138 [Closterium sp. NIES-68]GJP86857.1 hypothetical protein CLOP_g16831 [Closterium sp. NIES-67]